MKKVFFTKTSLGTEKYLDYILQKADFNKCYCVFKKGSFLINDNLLKKPINFIEFTDFGSPDIVMANNQNNIMVVIGLSEMIRPSNRCNIKFEYMYNFGDYKAKFVIDSVPFLIHKWRIWYPYGLVKNNAFGYPHSYAIESAYRSYEEGRSQEDPLTIKWMAETMSAITKIDYKNYFDFDLSFVEHTTTVKQKNEYEVLKEDLFAKHKTISPILSALHKYSKNVLKENNLFLDLKKIYKVNEDIVFYHTDLGIDKYIKTKLTSLISETNELTRRFADENLFKQNSFGSR